ncbi:P-loop ATPase, Sll1717 family [Variovorax boronicumulans]
MSFKKIEFGRTSGETEAAELPHLVADGYFDAELLDPLLSRDQWLVLARKGAGKSLLGEKIKQLCNAQSSSSATVTHLADFPYKSFAQLMPPTVEGASRYPASWAWLLCLQIIEALSVHPAANRSLNIDENGSINQLKEIGLLPTNDLRRLVVRSSKSGFKAQIPQILEVFNEGSSGNAPLDLAFLNLVDNLKRLIGRYSFHGSQYLIVDGLDDVLTDELIQYETLSALIFETARLNSFFKQNKINVWIIILCRTDIYEVLPGANKNKIRQDYCVELDWYPPSGEVTESRLLELANLRTRLSLGVDIDVFSEFFPAHMDHGVSTRKFLTDLTRHTPRDFIALLNHIQKKSPDNGVLTKAQILNGARAYSEKYFLPEIKDELVGYVTPAELEIFLNSVGELHERAFTTSKLESVAEKLGLPKAKLSVLLHALFAASAIGLTWRDKRTRTNKFEFKFRNPNATFNPARTVVLHKGLWKALNIN